MHMRNLSEDELAASGRSRNGRQYPMGLHQSGECRLEPTVATTDGRPLLRTVTPYIPAASYHFVNGQPQASFLVFTWALTDSGGEDGGFTVVPYGAPPFIPPHRVASETPLP